MINRMTTDMLRTYAFVDADYLRNGLRDIGVDGTTVRVPDVVKVAMQDVQKERGDANTWLGRTMRTSRIFIYGAIDEESRDTSAVEAWLKRNGEEFDTHVRWGRLAGTPGKGRGARQKAVDVQLAVDAVVGAGRGIFDVALLLAGDADFVPVVEAIREAGPLVAVYAFKKSLAAELHTAADHVAYLRTDPASWEAWTFPKG